MALPIEEAERIKNEIKSNPCIEDDDIVVWIFEPSGETAVIVEAEKLNDRQMGVIMEANQNKWSWFVDGQSDKGIRVSIW